MSPLYIVAKDGTINSVTLFVLGVLNIWIIPLPIKAASAAC